MFVFVRIFLRTFENVPDFTCNCVEDWAKIGRNQNENISCWLAIGETVTLVAVNERVNWVWCGVNMSVGGLAGRRGW